MAAPSLKELQATWAEDDGALFDIFVTDTTARDWQVVVDAVREKNWPTAYTVDGVAAEMPQTIRPTPCYRDCERKDDSGEDESYTEIASPVDNGAGGSPFASRAK